MKNHTSENYLDQLLNSINGGGEGTRSSKSKRNRDRLRALDPFERDLFGEPDSPETMSAKDEEAFLREFEEELLTDDIPNFDESFLDEEKPQETDSGRDIDATDASIDAMLNHMDSYSGDVQGTAEAALVDENAEFDGQLSGNPMFSDGEESQTAMEQSLDAAMDEFGGEADLSGMGGSDLMDLLSEQDGMSDLSDMLSADSEGISLDGGDQIGSFAEGEMEAQLRDASPESDAPDGKRKKKKKKKKEKAGKEGGFLSKLTGILFGADETPADDLTFMDLQGGTDVGRLSDENLQILKELEGSDGAGAPGGKKKKEKKEKKAKTPKPKKEPKPKKPPKPKKEKKPKEKDNTPPLPRGPVLAIVIMVASLFGLVMLGTNLLGYQATVNEAKTLYANGSYAEAYAEMVGLDVKARDAQLYLQLSVLAPTSAEYNSYLIFASAGMDDKALNALVCAYGRYNSNRDNARKYECVAELEILGKKVIKSLLEDYDMTGSEALEIYNSRNRKEYTVKLHEKYESLDLE